MTVINTNVGALQARTYAVRADSSVTKAMERLSSGLRINSAADDAAGLAVANKMESQIRGMNMAIRNSQDGISLVQTAEAAMGEINNMVIRMRELAVQMNNGVYTDADRANAQLEVTALLAEIDKVADNSAFNQVKILDGTYSQDIRAGNTNPEVINVTIDRMNTDSLGGGRVLTGETAATLEAIPTVVAGVDVNTAVGSNTAKHFETTITASEGRPTIALSELGLDAFASNNAGGTYQISPAASNSDHATFAIVGSEITLASGTTELDFEGGSSAAGTDTYSFKVSYTKDGVTVTDDISLNITDKNARTSNASVGVTGTVMEAAESVCVNINAATLLSDESNEFITAAGGVANITFALEDGSGLNSGDRVAGGFAINDTTGMIQGNADFERPTDVGANNSYFMTVKMTNNDTGIIMREEIQVNITDYAQDVADTSAASADAAVPQIMTTGSIAIETNSSAGQTIDLTTVSGYAAFLAAYPDANTNGWEVVSVDGVDAGTGGVTTTDIATGVAINAAGTMTVTQNTAVAGTIENVLIRATSDTGETFELLTDIAITDAGGAAPAAATGTYTEAAVTGNHSTLAIVAGGEAAVLDLTVNEPNGPPDESKFDDLAVFYAANQCGLFSVENLSFNGGVAPAVGEPTVKVNNSGELILEEGIAAGTYSLDVRYETNDGAIFLQRMDLTVTEVGIRGENVTPGNAAVTTASVISHATSTGTKVAAESRQVAGTTVVNMAEGRQGTLSATGGVTSDAFDAFVSNPDFSGGTFSLSSLNNSGDADLFTIDATTGAIKTKGLVDYESKTQYNITVTYTTADENNPKTYHEDITINVADNKVDNTNHITNVNLGTQADSATAVGILDTAINQITSSQAKLGAIQNRLQYNIDNLTKATMLTQTAKGRIMDADFAAETSELSKQQILSQAATSMLAQANQSKQSVLALLQ